MKKVILACLLCSVFCNAVAQAATVPISVPIHFEKDERVEIAVTITNHRVYYLDLVFLFTDERERASARRVAGEPTRDCMRQNNCGEISSFEIKIISEGNLIFQTTKKAFGTYAHGRGFFRNILRYPLRPGTYNVEVKPIEFGQEIRNVKTEILLTTDPRSADLKD